MSVSGIKFWCYNAGHVLGAAMFMIEIAGVKASITTIIHDSSSLNTTPHDMINLMVVSVYYVFFFKILYTGDFSREEDRHLMAAEVPTIQPDVLIIVSP